ncbi:MAG: hypothetical protein WCI97_02115 [Bacteroidota bacterium]
MNSTILLVLIFFLVIIFIIRMLMEGAQAKLTAEQKLSLLDSFTRMRKLRSISIIVLAGGFFLLLYLLPQYASALTISFFVVFVMYFLSVQYFTLQKLKSLNMPPHYITRYLLSTGIFIVGFIGILVFMWMELNKKSSWEYAADAYKNLERKNYNEAISNYNLAIEEDSLGNYFLNRGTAKYFTLDTTGACADWKQAQKLGESSAENYLNNFCR